MNSLNLNKAGLFAVVLVILLMGSWEIYLRSQGNKISYDDGKELWADKRAMVYELIVKATVFIGSSRNKYDIDIDTWQDATNDHVIQLAVEGNSPLPILDDLANDTKFKGKLVVDVTERLFFSTRQNNIGEPKENVAYYKERTPAQRCSFKINHILESQFVFLDRNYFALNSFFNNIKIPKRKGISEPPFEYPMEAARIRFDRQNYMLPGFLTDTVSRNKVKAIWEFYEKRNKERPAEGDRLDSFFNAIKTSVDKIRARGGIVLFVRTPSSGYYWALDTQNFPRDKYWDKLISYVSCEGIHFKDFEDIAHFECPEWSHLSQPQAIIFTKKIVEILKQEKSWKFSQKQTTVLNNINLKKF